MARTLTDPPSGTPRSSARAAKSDDVAALQAQIAALTGDMATLTALVREMAAERAAGPGLQDRVAEAAGEAADRAREAASEAASRAMDEATAFARRHPETAMGLSVGLGFLIGLVLTRR